MKIGIITLHRAENYGSVLQTLALQLKLIELGHSVEILDYWPERYTNKGKLKRLKNQKKLQRNPLLLLLAKILIYPSYLKKNAVFNRFINKYLMLTDFTFSTNEEAKNKVLDYDGYCTGSDQVWNSYWNEGIEKALFLDFVPKEKLIFSYASSIGLSDFPEEEKQETKSLLEKYKYISVREDTGVSILEKMGFKNVVQSLDPTLLLTKEEWEQYVDNKYCNKKYILTYNLHHDKEIDKYAQALSSKYNLPIYNISYNWHDCIRKGKLKWCPSVELFLGLIKHAQFVIADSFHATVFSIIFEKQFVIITPEIASSRISSILSSLGLSDRNLLKYENTKMIETYIDYSKVKNKLSFYKKDSLNYLKTILN